MAFVDPGGALRSLVSIGRRAETPLKVILAEDCELGDILGYSSGWVRALATVGTAIQGRLVALKAGQADEAIEVSEMCEVEYNPAVGEELTPGGYVYVAEAALNGEITQTAPSDTGDCDTIIGIALSHTRVLFFLNSRVDSLSA